VFTTYCSKSQAQPGSHYFFHVHGGGVSFFIGCGLLPTPEVIQSNAPSCSARLTLSVERTGESPPRLQSNDPDAPNVARELSRLQMLPPPPLRLRSARRSQQPPAKWYAPLSLGSSRSFWLPPPCCDRQWNSQSQPSCEKFKLVSLDLERLLLGSSTSGSYEIPW